LVIIHAIEGSLFNNRCKDFLIIFSCSPQIINLDKNARLQSVINEATNFSLFKIINAAIMALKL
jgi:hypothetical protein